MITIFTLINSFNCFFLKKLDNFVFFITPVVENIRRGKLKKYNCIYTTIYIYIYISGPAFVKTASELIRSFIV